MYQLYRIDLVTLRKYAVGNPNANQSFLVDCVRDEYPSISVAMAEDGSMNLTGYAVSVKGVRTSEVWLIEEIVSTPVDKVE